MLSLLDDQTTELLTVEEKLRLVRSLHTAMVGIVQHRNQRWQRAGVKYTEAVRGLEQLTNALHECEAAFARETLHVHESAACESVAHR